MANKRESMSETDVIKNGLRTSIPSTWDTFL